jgi:ATP phosphoribosyltransferase regulatory subunit
VTRWFVTTVLQRGLPDRLPVRVSCRGPVFRNVRPSGGLLKEFRQAGVERIGDSGFEADAEVLDLACECCRASGLARWHVSLGHAELLRSALDALGFGSRKEILAVADEVERETRRIRRNAAPATAETGAWERRFGPDRAGILSALAVLEGGPADFFVALEGLVRGPGIDRVASELLRLCDRLVADGVDVRLRAATGRGPAYYSGFAFEVHATGTGGGGLCGGGRYDPLHRWVFNRARQTAVARGRAPETLPEPPDAALRGAGFAFGVERLAAAILAAEEG